MPLPTHKLIAATSFAVLLGLGALALTATNALAAGTSAAERVSWAEPVPGLLDRVIRDYDAPLTRWGPGHRGIDFIVEAAEPISSPLAGSVHFAGQVVNRPVVTVIDSAGQLASFEPVCSDRVIGESVSIGSVIGWHCDADSNYEQHCGFECVHFSARRSGNYLSPLQLIYGLEPSRLWPLPVG